MKKILCYTICLLLAACRPRVSETTLILFGPDGTILRRGLHCNQVGTILSEIPIK